MYTTFEGFLFKTLIKYNGLMKIKQNTSEGVVG